MKAYQNENEKTASQIKKKLMTKNLLTSKIGHNPENNNKISLEALPQHTSLKFNPSHTSHTKFFNVNSLSFEHSKSHKDLPSFNYEDKGLAYSFGYRPRMFEIKDNANNPGPGKYNHFQLVGNENPKYSMRSSRPATCKDSFLFNQGPGKYSQNQSNRVKSASFRMSKADRFFDPVFNQKVMVPCPQKYNKMGDSNQYFDPKWGFGSCERNPKLLERQVNPGPGNYNVTSNDFGGKKFSFSNPKLTNILKKSKGSFNYEEINGDMKENTVKSAMSEKKIINETTKKPKVTGWSFSKSRKDDMYRGIEKKIGPSPGANSIKSSFGIKA